jgi:hypothetical protein
MLLVSAAVGDAMGSWGRDWGLGDSRNGDLRSAATKLADMTAIARSFVVIGYEIDLVSSCLTDKMICK